MEYILGTRTSGKTKAIAQRCIRSHGILFTDNTESVTLILQKYPKLKGRVFPWANRVEICAVTKHVPKFIDNADLFLNWLLDNQIVGISLTAGN